MNTITCSDLDRDRSIELVRRFPLRPLQPDDDLDHAIAMVDEPVSRLALLEYPI